MTRGSIDHGSAETYKVREVVGLFADPKTLELAIDELEVSGFDRSSISVLAQDKGKWGAGIAARFKSAAAIADDPGAVRTAAPDSDSATEGKALAIGVPAQIGAMLGAVMVVASGGIVAGAIAAAIAGGVLGGGLGALLLHSVSGDHRQHIQHQIANGGLLLWVTTPDSHSEERAQGILNAAGASHVHAHEIARTWGPKDIPFSTGQPDPLLE